MNSYVLTSQKFDGAVKLEYNSNNQLVSWSVKEADLSPKRYDWLLTHIPAEEKAIAHYRKQGFAIKKIAPDLSFEAFWIAYKGGSAKREAERTWNKLSELDRAVILESIPRYERYLTKKPNLQKMYPATYINPKNERWLDQY